MNVDPNRAKAIFLEAVEKHDDAEWPAFLDRSCADQPELRRRVEVLLEAHREAGTKPHRAGSDQPTASVDSPADERPGTLIGPYKLLQQIGEGGMGTVFMAEQTQPVRRKVALKVIKPGMDSRQVIARFEAERQALAMMDHVNIARVFDAGATESGRPYFVMELVHGVPITKYCDDNHLTPRERLELFVPVCQAIQHAHQKGIIHRDVKPSNVMVTLYDGKPVPKVIDFGVAKATEQKLTERTLSTQYGTMVGTLEYMSPEQAEMSALGVDTRSDIYSLGVLLYELLTGSTPLSHKRVKEAAYAEILRMIKEEEPPKPSTRLSDSGEALASISAQRHMEPAKLTKLVRGELDWIVMKGLDKDRTRRYETASALAQDIQHYLADEPVLAGPPSTGYRLRKFVKRNRGPVVAAAMLLLAVLAGIAGTSWGWIDARSQRDDAVQARTREEVQRRLALVSAAEAKANELRAKNNELKAAANAALATQQEQLAREQAKIAQVNESKAEWRLYASNIASAQREWETHNTPLLYHYLNQCRPDFRGWEHDFLYTLANQNHQTLRGHTGDRGVVGVAFSPDGKLLASAGSASAGSGGAGGGKTYRKMVPGEVKLWDAASGQLVGTLTGDASGFTSVAFSLNGKHLATTSSKRQEGEGGGDESTLLTVWDAASFQKIWTVEELGTRCLAFSPDGKRLASASMYNRYDDSMKPVLPEPVRVRDAASGKEIMTLNWPLPVHSLAFSPDGKLLAGATTGPPVFIAPDKSTWREGEGLVKLWDATSGKEIRTLQGHTGSLAFSPDGKHLASALYKHGPGLSDRRTDYTVKVWDVASGEELLTFMGHTPNDTNVAFSLYGSPSVAYSPDGKLLAVGLDLWEAATGKEAPMTFKGQTGSLTSVAFSPDGKRLASASDDNTVKLWDLAGTPGALTIPAWGRLPSAAFSPDGKLAIASGDTVKLFDPARGQEIQTLIKEKPMAAGAIGKRTAEVSHISFSPDGKRLAGLVGVPLLDTVKVWDAATGQETLSLKGQVYNRVYCVAFTPDGKLLTSAVKIRGLWAARILNQEIDDTNFAVKLWDAASGKEIRTFQAFQGNPSLARSVAFSPDGKRLATAGHESATGCTIQVWDAASGQELLTLKARTGFVHSMAFSPDGKRLATGGIVLGSLHNPGAVTLWDAATGQEVLSLKGHTERVMSVAFSPDGKRLVSGSMDKTVKLWDVASGQEVLTLKGPAAVNSPVAFSPDGKRLTSVHGNTIMIWDASKSMKEAGPN